MHSNKFFAIARVLVGRINLVFSLTIQSFTAGLFYHRVLFHLGVSVHCPPVVYKRDDVSCIVLASARHVTTVIGFSVNQKHL